MAYRIIQGDTEDFTYDGHFMTEADGVTLDWNLKGNMLYLPLKYNSTNSSLVVLRGMSLQLKFQCLLGNEK